MRVAFGIVAALLFAAGLVYATLAESEVSCEVCVEFAGERACGNVSAADRDRAMGMALSNACAVLVRGVTPGMQCRAQQPASVSCSE